MRLLEPLQLGRTELRNRIVFGPHETNLGRGRAFSDRHVAYYERRAVGGAGLIVTEEASVHNSDWPYERCPRATDSGPGWQAIAAACHPHGAAVVAALGHAGMQGSSAYSQRETWAPSHVADVVTRELPKAMEAEDIEAVLDGFEHAARLAVVSGVDGVEVNAGQHSLVRQFLSGLTNLREDVWGGGEDGTGRLRFATEVLARVRAAVGDGIVGLRLSCDELAPWAGLTPESSADIAAALGGSIDYLVVVRGSIYSADATRPDSHVDAGFNLGLVEQHRAAVPREVALVAQGSIVDWGQAEWAIDDGRCDAVEMTRAQLADPDLAAKLVSGHNDRVRPCIRCNQRCQVRDARNPIVSCVVNPTVGFETTEDEAPPVAAHRRRFVVIGAGPAGLEAARVLAEAGHSVSVNDQRSETGGIVRDWSHATGRAPLVAIVDWLEAECRRLGVEIHLGERLEADDIEPLRAGGAEIIWCPGGQRGRRTYEVAGGKSVENTVIDALDLLAALRAGDGPPAGPVVVWDPIGGPVGISVAETLAPLLPVTLLTPDVITGMQLSMSGDLAASSTRLLQAGVTVVKHSVLRAVRAGEVEIEDRITNGRSTLAAATLVDAGHRHPTATPVGDAAAGDAVAPRTLHEAILEGRRVAIAASEAADRARAVDA
ncbi:MAG: mycofactocin system FadH/OYE family oxidoreductase 1 [Acidimicrobiia bacterium]|nr:mycofactocin system FadH/OYE family oxidoreductase 1 [Acidimicrobiia bacterium]